MLLLKRRWCNEFVYTRFFGLRADLGDDDRAAINRACDEPRIIAARDTPKAGSG